MFSQIFHSKSLINPKDKNKFIGNDFRFWFQVLFIPILVSNQLNSESCFFWCPRISEPSAAPCFGSRRVPFFLWSDQTHAAAYQPSFYSPHAPNNLIFLFFLRPNTLPRTITIHFTLAVPPDFPVFCCCFVLVSVPLAHHQTVYIPPEKNSSELSFFRSTPSDERLTSTGKTLHCHWVHDLLKFEPSAFYLSTKIPSDGFLFFFPPGPTNSTAVTAILFFIYLRTTYDMKKVFSKTLDHCYATVCSRQLSLAHPSSSWLRVLHPLDGKGVVSRSAASWDSALFFSPLTPSPSYMVLWIYDIFFLGGGPPSLFNHLCFSP